MKIGKELIREKLTLVTRIIVYRVDALVVDFKTAQPRGPRISAFDEEILKQ